MNGTFSQNTWQSLTGRYQPQCLQLTEEVATQIDGQRVMIVAKLQERFGFTKEQAEYVLDDFVIKRR